MAEELEKVHIDLPNHWGTGGESLWARRIGMHLFEIRNVPFFAYGLNYLDVVVATSDAPELKPTVRRVETPSGHQTLRVIFSEDVPKAKQLVHLAPLSDLYATLERANNRHLAIDITPKGDVDTVRAFLDGLETIGALEYESCEARVPGSFDDIPEPGD
jgi:hypothetical protein